MLHRHHSIATLAGAALLGGLLLLPTVGCAEAKGGASSTAKSNMILAPAKANGSGIDLSHQTGITAQVGVPTTIAIGVDGVTEGSSATMRFSADPGLRLGADAEARALSTGASSFSITVTPMSEGLLYVHVFTAQGGRTSVTSIPVQVGKGVAAMPANPSLKQTPSGDSVIVLPSK